MTKVFVSAVIDAPVEKVWAKMRDFNGLPEWHPRFSRSHIEGGLRSDTVGCIRNFDIAGGGGTIRERLLTLSDADYTMTYCILDAPLPVENYVATLKLYPITVGNKTLGTWSAEFKVTKGREEDVVEAVANGTFGKAFEVMNELLSKGKQ
ncbi:MAG TPA: SRPBCC family protein [Terriglobales bacterium]|nr:SRPBCC family protein [Terriglobales bacterium]